MEHRRRVVRRSAGWFGICHIEGESDPSWRDCQVIDISLLGLGITLHHFWPAELVGRHITVEAPAAGDAVNVRLEGTIKNADRGSGGIVRMGIEFVGVISESELAVADALGSLLDGEVGVSTLVAEQKAAEDYASTSSNS